MHAPRTTYVLARLGAVVLVLAAFAGVAGVASATSPDGYLHGLNAAPLCPTTSPGPLDQPSDTCQIRFFTPVVPQALTGQSILFRVGDFEASRADCDAFTDSTVVTFAIDGVAVPVTAVTCRFIPRPVDNIPSVIVGYWFVDFRYVSAPGQLAPGSHTAHVVITAVADYSYSLLCDDPSGRCVVPAGTVTLDATRHFTVVAG